MKTYVFFIVCILSSLYQTANSQLADERITELMNQSDWFTLEKELPELKKDSEWLFLQYFAEVMINYSFNRPEQAIVSIDSLLKNHQAEIGFENIIGMLALRNGILKHKGEYKIVQESVTSILEELSQYVSAEELPDLNFLALVATSFQNEKPPLLTRPAGDIEIPCTIEEVRVDTTFAGHQLMITAKINGGTERFIVDTGAEYTFLMENVARRNQVRFLCDSMSVTGAAAEGMGRYGITDRLEIGDILYENAFTIIPYPDYEVDTIIRIDAILGRDFLTAMSEIIIYPQEEKIVFPGTLTPLPATGRNMIIENGQPWILSYTNGEKVMLHFDTGAGYSGLNSHYFTNHKEEILKTSTLETRTIGGFGGLQKFEMYRMPEFPLQIGETSLLLENVGVQIEDFNGGLSTKDGVLGMDFILKCKKVTINFKDMFIIAEI